MLPTPSASPRVAPRLAGLALVALLAGALAASTDAAPLPPNGVESFQKALGEISALAGDDPSAVAVLVRFRKDLREAARQLPSLGDVSRVLLLQDWRATDFTDADTPAMIEKIEAAVRQPTDEAFRRAVENLLKTETGENKASAGEITWQVSIGVKREVRLRLLERFENRLDYYLRSGRPADRIAAANLISETMGNARKQVSVEIEIRRSAIPSEEIVKGKTPAAGKQPAAKAPTSVGTRFLRERLARLGQDLKRLTEDRDPQVQVAAVRALSDIESPQVSVAILRNILARKEGSVLLRRATAEGLGHMIDLVTKQMDNDRYVSLSEDRFLSPLSTLETVLPAAVLGLTDSDLEVRRQSVETCQKVAATLNELVSDKSVRPRLASFDPMLKAVRQALPALGATAQDVGGASANGAEGARQAEIRRTACHVLETLVLVTQTLDRLKKSKLPEPTLELPELPDMDKKTDKEGKKGAPLPPGRGNRQSAVVRPSQWAAARPGRPAGATAPAPAVTLGRPRKLAPEELARRSLPADSAPHAVAFIAQKKDEELPPPAPLGVNLRGTVDAMIKGLEDPDYHVRLAAVDVLETSGEAAVPAIPALTRALSDRNKFVRWSAARTLGRLHPRQAKLVVPALTRLLNDREDLSVRITAAYALEKYGPDAKEAVPHLARVLNRGDKEYIIAVLHTIQAIGTDATPALPSVAWVLRDRDLASSVRIEAAQTLGRFGRLAMGQIRDLRQVMETDADEEVRNAASAAVLAVDRPK